MIRRFALAIASALLIATSASPASAWAPPRRVAGVPRSANLAEARSLAAFGQARAPLRGASRFRRPTPSVAAPWAPTPASPLNDSFFGAAIGQLPRVLVGSTPQDAAYDPATHTVYVADNGAFGPPGPANTLSVIDARTCNARTTAGCGRTPPTVAAGNGPFSIAIDDATHTVYVTDEFSDTVSVINAATCNAEVTVGCNQTPQTITVGVGPNGVAVDPATDTVYVADSGPVFAGTGATSTNTVSVIDGATCNAEVASGCGQTPPTVTVGNGPFSVTLDPDNHTLYVANANDNTVSMVDTRTCRVGDTAGCSQTPSATAAGDFPVSGAVDLRSDTVYLADNNAPTVSLIDGATCNATDTSGCRQNPIILSTLGSPDGVAVNQATNTLFVANNGPGSSTRKEDSVSIVNAATCNARATWGCDRPAPSVLTGANPGGNTIDETTNTLYVTTFDDSVQVIDPEACDGVVMTGCGQTTPATFAGADAFSMATNPTTHTVYVGDSGGTEGFPFGISVLDSASCTPDDHTGCSANPPFMPMQDNPYGVAVDPSTDTVYATNFFDANGNPGDTVSVFDGARCNAAVTSGCGNAGASVTVGSGPAGIAVNPKTHTVYVANINDGTLSVIDGRHCYAGATSGCGQASATVSLGNLGFGPSAVAVDQTTDTVYVLNPGQPGAVSVVDGGTCNAADTSGCAAVPPAVNVGSDNNVVVGLAVDEITDTVYVVNNQDNTVSVIDGATCNGTVTTGCGQTPSHVDVGRQGFGFVAVDQATALVYVTDNLDDTVSVIDGATCNATTSLGCAQIPATVATGGNPAGVTLNPDNHTVYVADNGGGIASFFRFDPPSAPTAVTVHRVDHGAEIGWQPPAAGGLPLIYRVLVTPACPSCTGLLTPPTSGIPATRVLRLKSGVTYAFQAQAIDAAGTSPASSPSSPPYRP